MLFRLVQPVKRPGSRNLQFVQRIPTDLRDRLTGRTLAIPVGDAVVHKTVSAKADSIRLSLRTCDSSEAKVRQAGVAAYLEAYFRSVREDVPVVLTQRQAVALSKALYDGWAEGADRGTERTSSVTFTPEGEVDEISSSGSDVAPEEEAAGFSAAVEHLVQSKAENDPAELESIFGGIVTRRLAAVSIPEVDPRSRLFLLSAFRDAAIDALGLRARHSRNDFTPDPQAARFPDWVPPRTQPDARSPGSTATSLRGLVDGWWREAKATGRKPSTHESYRNTMEAFVAFLKHDDPQRVTPEDVIAFKDHRLATINPRSGKPISPKTVKDSDLAGLKTIFGWAVANRKMASNPAEGVKLKLKRPTKTRSSGFTDAEAGAILSAALKVERGAEFAETFAAKRWVPWLCAYTGARVGEIAQLRKDDVRQDGGLWTLTITPEAGTVKTDEARTIPLHPHLVALGFPEFVRQAPTGHLFLRPAKNGDVLGPLQGVKNRLAEFARAIVPDRNVAPNHGWRHRFKTVGLEAGIDHRTLDTIQGHSPRTAGESYGEVTLKAMAAAIGKLPRYEVKRSGEWAGA